MASVSVRMEASWAFMRSGWMKDGEKGRKNSKPDLQTEGGGK